MKLEVNVTKKNFAFLSFLILSLFGAIVVYAFGTNNPEEFGHSLGEVQMPACSENQVLVKTSSGWGCGSSGGAVVSGDRLIGANVIAFGGQVLNVNVPSGADYAMVSIQGYEASNDIYAGHRDIEKLEAFVDLNSNISNGTYFYQIESHGSGHFVSDPVGGSFAWSNIKLGIFTNGAGSVLISYSEGVENVLSINSRGIPSERHAMVYFYSRD